MMDHDNLLEKLRDIHPPAPDGTSEIITMSILGGIIAIAVAMFFYFKQDKNRNIYVRSLNKLNRHREGSPTDRLAIQAGVLRDIMVIIDPGTIHLRGEEWLGQLDAIFHTSYFTRGPGRIYGEDLYRQVSIVSIDTLESELCRLLARFKNVRD